MRGVEVARPAVFQFGQHVLAELVYRVVERVLPGPRSVVHVHGRVFGPGTERVLLAVKGGLERVLARTGHEFGRVVEDSVKFHFLGN